MKLTSASLVTIAQMDFCMQVQNFMPSHQHFKHDRLSYTENEVENFRSSASMEAIRDDGDTSQQHYVDAHQTFRACRLNQ